MNLWRFGAGVATVALGVGVYWAARLACADYAPGNAEYWLRVADAREEAGEPAGDAVERAVAANPQDAQAWMRWGLQAETEGNQAQAERRLLEAARVSRLYEPAWTLANYYFRRNNAKEFRRWMKTAAERSYGDRKALFDLEWEMGGDAEDRLQLIPAGGAAGRDYLDYLVGTGRLDAAEGAARRLCGQAAREDRDAVLRYVNRMLEAGRTQAAAGAWDALCRRGVIPYEALDARRGRPLTNGDFARAPLGAGFDWRMGRAEGMATAWSGSPAYVRVEFSGKQPERCEAMAQYAPVEAGRRYRLRYAYRTRGIGAGTGLGWKIYGAEAPAAGRLASEEWRTEAVDFGVPPGTDVVRVALVYERTPGTVRIEGDVEVRAVSLEEAR